MKTKLFPFLAPAILAVVASVNLHAQTTIMTYQGRLTNNGTNFTGTGQFKFALVTSVNSNLQATATANLGGVSPNFFVSSCTLTRAGSGYTSTPAVVISGGGGSGATASATLSGQSVGSVTVLNPGSGYDSPPVVTIAPPPPNISYTTFWSNDGSSASGSEPAFSVTVTVSDGLFTVALGDPAIANMTTISAALFDTPNLQLRIWFNDGVSGFTPLSPLQNLTAVPYAAIAQSLPNLRTANSQNGPTFQSANLIGGSTANTIAPGVTGAVIAGGGATQGFPQTINAFYSFIGGGYSDTIGVNGAQSTIAGGAGNTANGQYNSIGGGVQNLTSGAYATIAGGNGNSASGASSTVGGGGNGTFGGNNTGNTASGTGATVPGGMQNTAAGNTSFAAGNRAKAVFNGSFVWGDSTDADATSTANDQFLVRANGGVVVNTAANVALNATSGVSLSVNANNTAVNPGTLFRDNTVVAWGHITGNNGGVVDGFNATATRNSAGNYTITLTSGLPGGHFMAVATPTFVIGSQPTSAATMRFATVNQLFSSSQFNVFINSGTFAAADNDFNFIVLGR